MNINLYDKLIVEIGVGSDDYMFVQWPVCNDALFHVPNVWHDIIYMIIFSFEIPVNATFTFTFTFTFVIIWVIFSIFSVNVWTTIWKRLTDRQIFHLSSAANNNKFSCRLSWMNNKRRWGGVLKYSKSGYRQKTLLV